MLILKAKYMEIPALHHETEVVPVAWNDRLEKKVRKYFHGQLSPDDEKSLDMLLKFGIAFYPKPCPTVCFVEKESGKIWRGIVRRIGGRVITYGIHSITACNEMLFLVNSLHQISKEEMQVKYLMGDMNNNCTQCRWALERGEYYDCCCKATYRPFQNRTFHRSHAERHKCKEFLPKLVK